MGAATNDSSDAPADGAVTLRRQPPQAELQNARQEILTSLKSLMEAGKLTPIIAKTFPLGEVSAAMRCLHDNMPGRVVITP